MRQNGETTPLQYFERKPVHVRILEAETHERGVIEAGGEGLTQYVDQTDDAW